MYRRYFNFIVSTIILFSGCAGVKREIGESFSTNNDHMIMSVLWTQKAAEYRALCYQAYNMAKIKLDQELQKLKRDKTKTKSKPAVVLDLDETILDNSFYQAKLITSNTSYPDGWKEWEAKSLATAVPGALEFLRYAESKKINIFYLTNRKIESEESTVINLTKLGFPINKESLIMRSEKDSLSMKRRREQIALKYHIVLLIGDSLSDFSEIFENASVTDRFKEVDRVSGEFGNNYIILPNSMYGSWEGAIYEYKSNKSDKERAQDRLKALITY
ncbi:MAG: 5'-nucleotidase, lipoprotein e(P4) family [Oligoflexia bacterium]|nr:5'-nucleotidase, lipoprotein e(P4) family [Oligoflexia bacterium]